MRTALCSAAFLSIAALTALILAATDSSRDSVERGIKAAAHKDFTGAESAYKEAIRQDSLNARAHKLLGLLYAIQQNYFAAEAPFRRACELAPSDEEAWYYLGRLFFNLNRFEESREVFQRAFQKGNSSSRLEAGLALTLEVLGHTDEAETHLRVAIRGGDKLALRQYGQFLFRQGRLKESIEPLRRAGDTTTLQRVARALEVMPRHASKSAPEPVKFDTSELGMVVRNGAAGEKHLIETMLAGVAVFDYDNDGWPDIFVSNGASVPSLAKVSSEYSNRLYRNNHDGTFVDVTEKAGLAGRGYAMGVAAADYDNDGWTDLFVTGVRENILYHNRGDGTFEEITKSAGVIGDGAWSVAAGWFDYDNDGLLDLFVVHYVEWKPVLEPFCGDPRTGFRSYCDPRFYEPLANALYHNEGNGTFRDVSASSGIAASRGKGMGVAFGDFDGDGLIDIFVANDTIPNFLFRNLGNGKFEETALTAGVAYNGDGRAVSSMGVDFRDYDNDGLEDLFVTALSNETFTLFRNVGGGRFQEATQVAHISAPSLPLSGWSTGFYDFNNDGQKDIFVANGHANDNAEVSSSVHSAQPNTVFINRGDGAFDLAILPGSGLHRGAAFGDLNRDGLIDVVVTGINMRPRILWNRTPTSNQWIEIKLRGHRSNRDGIGANIHLVSANSSQWNRVETSIGYAGSSERIAHFGLGSDSVVGRVEIGWPSGSRQVLRDIHANQRIVVEEPF